MYFYFAKITQTYTTIFISPLSCTDCDRTTFLANMSGKGRGAKGNCNNNSEPSAVESRNDSDHPLSTGEQLHELTNMLGAMIAHEKYREEAVQLCIEVAQNKAQIEILNAKDATIEEKFITLSSNYDHVSSELFQLKQDLDEYKTQNTELLKKNEMLTQQLETTLSNADDVEMAQCYQN